MFKGRSFLVKMVKDDEQGHQEEVDVNEELKNHFEKNKVAYITGGICAAMGLTYLITRGAVVPHIDREVSVIAKHGIAVQGKNVVMRNISYISSHRQGPPSWVVRCKETGEIFTSQNAAAAAMGISASNLSQHLNGVQEAVNGHTFERICLAA